MDIIGLCFSDSAVGIHAHHDLALVVLGYLVAVGASFAALDMAERLRHASGLSRRFWHWGAALVLGGGIWSMHFIAILAYRTPIGVAYDVGQTLLTGAIAIIGVGVGFQALGRGSLPRIIYGGVLVGLSVAVMHYMGMGAMRMPGVIYYRPGLFALSILIAIIASTVALWLTVALQTTFQRAAASLVMAAAVAGMHFTGMAGTVVVASSSLAPVNGVGLLSASLLAAAIGATISLILIVGLVCAYYDRLLEARAASEAERLRQLNEGLEARVESRTSELTSALGALDEQRRRAEAANHAKSEFLANMSHELRTPLNAVIGFAEILQLQRNGVLSASQAEAVQQICKSGRHLLGLIEEVLDFARIESGKLTVLLDAVSPHELVEDLLANFRPQAETAQVTLMAPAAAGAIAVQADALRLRQVLANLISNAIKYNRPGGEVVIGVHAAGDWIEITVKDTGLGIPEDRMANLFEPFDRLGRETLAVEGAGLGLALSKRLVEAMEGELSAESATDRGSTFTVRLPAADSHAEHEPAAMVEEPQAEAAPPEAVVLYIEDNASNIRLMRHVADALGTIELHVAEHPVIGLAMAEKLRPDIILLDINLPEMDGFEVKSRLAQNAATRDIPVIALSANVLTETFSRGRAAGFAAHLTKPLNIEALVAAMRQALEPQTAGRPVSLAAT